MVYLPVTHVVITDWALNAYIDLLHRHVFARQDYWNTLRPDVELLAAAPMDTKFQNDRFWGPVTDKSGTSLPNSFKMKWRQLGPGRVQLRLLVAILAGDALLCDAYVKNSTAIDKRMAAIMKSRVNTIAAGRHTIRGSL